MLIEYPSIKRLNLSRDIVELSVVYHDSMVWRGREKHHTLGADYLESHRMFLRNYYSDEEIDIAKQAVKDHRASSKEPPKSIYGKILADADKISEVEEHIERSIMYNRDHYPSLGEEELYLEVYSHLKKKYGYNGYAKYHLAETKKIPQVKRMREVLENEKRFQAIYKKIKKKI